MAPGYSGKPLPKKLGIKEGDLVAVLGDPVDYAELLGQFPPGVEIINNASRTIPMVHLFVTKREDLERHLKGLRKILADDATIWISWPKKASKVPTTVTEDGIRELALPLGLVDIKVCAVSDVWSGLKLVVRKELRK